MITKTIIAIAAAFLLTTAPSFGQQADDDAALQQVLSDHRACVRSNAPEVYALGIRTTQDAEEIFRKRCNALNNVFALIKFSEINERAMPSLPALRPGIFRITVREEWAVFLDSVSGK